MALALSFSAFSNSAHAARSCCEEAKAAALAELGGNWKQPLACEGEDAGGVEVDCGVVGGGHICSYHVDFYDLDNCKGAIATYDGGA